MVAGPGAPRSTRRAGDCLGADYSADAAGGTPEELALLTQAFIKDAGQTIGSLIQDQIAQTGENIRVARFSRFELGGQ